MLGAIFTSLNNYRYDRSYLEPAIEFVSVY